MIPQAYIIEWRSSVPWKLDEQVEQDLILSRALVEIFSNQYLAENLCFRGGTALYKLMLKAQARYSENIDLVQIKPESVGKIIDEIRKVLSPLIGKPRIRQREKTQLLQFKMSSEIPPVVPIRLKIEINTREHFAIFGFHKKSFFINSRWFSGSCEITTFDLNELLGTKLRALYQRSKGRDLFDLWYAMTYGNANPAKIVQAFKKYLGASDLKISKTEFRQNLELKIRNNNFLHDTDALLNTSIRYDPYEAYKLVDQAIIEII